MSMREKARRVSHRQRQESTPWSMAQPRIPDTSRPPVTSVNAMLTPKPKRGDTASIAKPQKNHLRGLRGAARRGQAPPSFASMVSRQRRSLAIMSLTHQAWLLACVREIGLDVEPQDVTERGTAGALVVKGVARTHDIALVDGTDRMARELRHTNTLIGTALGVPPDDIDNQTAPTLPPGRPIGAIARACSGSAGIAGPRPAAVTR